LLLLVVVVLLLAACCLLLAAAAADAGAALMLLWRHTAASCPNATHLSSNRTIVFSPRSLFSVRSAHLFEISVVFSCQI
jgi:hypothetical protein